MPLDDKTISGFERKYCIYCQDQTNGDLATFDQVRKGSIEAAIRLLDVTKKQAEKMADEMMPQLPRWKK